MGYARKSVLLIALIFSVLNNEADAQYKATPSIGMELGAKLFPVQYYNQLATFQPSLMLRIGDRYQRRLGLWLRAGILWDPSLYKLKSESTPANRYYIYFMHRSLSFESLISFPLRNERLSFVAGIGIDYKLPVTTAYRVASSTGISTFTPGGAIDTIQQLANRFKRPAIPSASIGLQYEVPWVKKLYLYALLRQNLLDAFGENIPAYSISTGKTEQAPTNYQPFYLRLGISCDLQ